MILLIQFILLVLLCILLFVIRIRKNKKTLRDNLSIGFTKPIFRDTQDNRYYSIICKCGNKFSVKTNAEWVECDQCRSFDKLYDIAKKFYEKIGK
jgi:hypothetical protein